MHLHGPASFVGASMIAIAGAAFVMGAPTVAGAAGVTIEIAHKAPAGDYLTDSHGRTLYLFEKDEDGQSNCYDACAHAWPPLLSDDAPSVATGLDASKLSTLSRKDGSHQVTYAGWPLYYFIKDDDAGDSYGQGVNGFGGEWYMVSPQGKGIEAGEKGDDQQQGKSKDNW